MTPAMRDKRAIRNSLRASILDGSFYCVMAAFSESYFVLFALFLGASNLELALMGSLGVFLGAIGQYYTPAIVSWAGSRKRPVVWLSVLQALMVALMPLAGLLPFARSQVLTVLVVMYWIWIYTLGPMWGSWMADLAQRHLRSSYFTLRNSLVLLPMAVSLLASGLIMEWGFDDAGRFCGFVLLFEIAAAARMISVYYLTRKTELPFEQAWHGDFSFLDYLRGFFSTPYGRISLYLCLLYVPIGLWLPFQIAYMKAGLGASYLQVTCALVLFYLAKASTVRLWGRLSRRSGDRVALRWIGYCFPLPLLMLLVTDHLAGAFVYFALEGVVMGGLEAVMFVCQLQYTEPELRTRKIGFLQVCLGMIQLLFGLAGGWLLDSTSAGTSPAFVSLILVVAALRVVAGFGAAPLLSVSKR